MEDALRLMLNALKYFETLQSNRVSESKALWVTSEFNKDLMCFDMNPTFSLTLGMMGFQKLFKQKANHI